MNGSSLHLAIGLVALAIAGCMSYQGQEKISAPIVADAEDKGENHHGCEDINDAFVNRGFREVEEGPAVADGMLSEHVLNRYLPEGEVVDVVRLESNLQEGTLIAKLIGRTSRTIRFAVTCASGWLVVVEERSNQYLGEGVTEKEFRQYTYFRLDEFGDLDARVATKAKFRTFYIFPSEDSSERKYRFESVSNDQE